MAESSNASDKMMEFMNGLDTLFSNPLPSLHPRDLLIGAGCGAVLRLVVYFKAKNAKKFRHGGNTVLQGEMHNLNCKQHLY